MRENRGRPQELNLEPKTKYILEFGDIKYYFDIDKNPYGFWKVEDHNSRYNKLEKLYEKLEKLSSPQYHPNGRKKRTTLKDKKDLHKAEELYLEEYYGTFPEERPKRKENKKKKKTKMKGIR